MIQRMFVTLDTKKTNYKNVGKINHGDDLILELTVLSDGDMISFNDPMVDLLVKKSDGKMIRQNSSIEHIKPNKFIIEVKKDCVTSPGLTTNQLIINDNGRISTCMFYYTVLNSLEEDVMPSISNVEVLEQLDEFVIQIKDKMEVFNSDLVERIGELTDGIVELEKNFNDTSSALNEAEVKRSEAEQLRAQAEALRVQNEDKRAESENVRVQNESDRVTAELIREQREVERVLNDEERHQNESERAMNEELRQQNESVRQSNESVRISNENDRKTQENRRVTAETNRVNAETTRRNNENSRISNETERQKTIKEMKSLMEDAREFDERVGVIEDEIEEINSSLDNITHNIDIKTKYVTYEMFGAKLDGVTDDSNAIINCHNYANENKLPIIQNGGIVKCNFTVEVKTSCNLNVDFLIDDNSPNTIYRIISDSEEEFEYNSSFATGQIEFDDMFKGKFFVPRLDNNIWLLGTRSMETNGTNYYHRQPIAVDKNGILISSPIYLGNQGNFTIKYCKDLSEKSVSFIGGRVITNLSKIGFPRLIKCSRNNTIIQNITIENTNLPSSTDNYPSGLIEIVGCANTTINNIFGTNNSISNTSKHSYIIDITDAYNVNISNCNLTQGWGVIATHFADSITITNSTINRVDNHYGLFGGFKFCNSTLTGISVLCAGYGNGDFIVDNVIINKTLNGSFIFYTRNDFNITYSGTLSLNKIKFTTQNFDRIIQYQLGTGTSNTDLSKGSFNIIANEITSSKALISNSTGNTISAQIFNCNIIPATSTSKVNIDIFNSKVSQLSSTGTIKLFNSTLNSIKTFEGTLYIFSSTIYATINNNSITIYATSCLLGNNIVGKSLYLIGCYATSPKTVTGEKIVLESCVNITQS